jgi:hypothetical protein
MVPSGRPSCRPDPEEDQQNYESHPISPKIISRHVLYLGILPAIGMVLATYRIIGGLGA